MPQDNKPFEVASLHTNLTYSDPPISRTVRVPNEITGSELTLTTFRFGLGYRIERAL